MPYDSFSTYGGAVASHEDTATSKAPSHKVSAQDAGGKIRFMVMSGFLGAGKTTTMIALGEHMDKTYGKVGIIANDLGANLVDTNLTQTSGCTVEEIASGCICYQMDNTIDKIRRLRDRDGAIFVMSDIPGLGVGALDHVYHRLADDCADWVTLSPFTVIIDPERLRMLLPEKADIHLPEELVYLMKLQLEEADLVVLNKIDLLSEEEIEYDVNFLKEACPDIPVMKISALNGDGIPELAEYLMSHDTQLKNFSVRDDERFQEAEKTLTWYNRRMFFKQLDDAKVDCNAVIDDFIEEIRMGLIERKRNVPHLKTFATAGAGDFNKCSLLGVDYDIEHTQPFLRKHKKMSMIVNARAVCESRPLARIVDDAVDAVCDKYNLDCQVFFTECFGMGDEGR